MIVFHAKLTALVVVSILVQLCIAFPYNCKQWKQTYPDITSNEYLVSNGRGKTHKVYCEFYNDHGYMFVPKDAFDEVNFDLLAPLTSDVLVRHLTTDNKQYETTLTQLSTYSHRPLSIQYNAYNNYQHPVNKDTLGPYFYLGFLPDNVASTKSKQGYRVNGNDIFFDNCDGNGNSYMAFYFDKKNGTPNGYYNRCNCYNDNVMKKWATMGKAALHTLSAQYFMTVEMHMGGCGGYTLTGYKSQAEIKGAALGMKFVV